jgi:hypothetical protein
MSEIFFYTTDYPHRWTSGPNIFTLDENYEPITSLERAKELAESASVGGSDEDTCWTSYGVMYKVQG